MKLKMLMAIILGLGIPFMATLTTFAASEPTAAMLEKQKEVDKIIFEDKKDELADKGITVTHTAPLENTIEIGVQPYNEETIHYLIEFFGEKNVTVVDGGQQPVIMTTNSNELLRDGGTPKESGSGLKPIYILAAIIVLCGGFSVIMIRKKLQKS
ncbi:hypothetical protein ACFVSW_01500 [Neobacillus sp. NPDC058068]|uniref:hypothetical protein n=1 Tax=Neobacillus sp. NPDC058068 TaxID=3346325 RepID=UPI0036D766CE